MKSRDSDTCNDELFHEQCPFSGSLSFKHSVLRWTSPSSHRNYPNLLSTPILLSCKCLWCRLTTPPRWPDDSSIRLDCGRHGFDSHFGHGSFSWSNHTCDLKICTPVAALPGAWCYKVRAGTGWPRCQYTATG